MSNHDAWIDLFEVAVNWVLSTTGSFSEKEFGDALSVSYDNITRQRLIGRLREYGIIQPHGNRNGWYIKSDTDAPIMDWQNALVDEYPIWMPLWLDKRVVISPGNVIVVAGEKNSGKTAFALRVAFENLACNGGRHHRINHFDYESHPAELKARLMSIAPKFSAWDGFVPKKRLYDFHKVIDPNGFNIIDYLKIGGTRAQFTEAGALFEQIHESLKDGICVVLVQKKRGEEYARGGELTTEEARLAISLFCDGPTKWAKITKCKFPREYPNPEGMEIDYAVDSSAHFDTLSEWRYVTEKEREAVINDNIMESRRRDAVSRSSSAGFDA